MNINRALLLVNGTGMDIVLLTTDLPAPPGDGSRTLECQFKVRKGCAEAYVAKTFPGVAVEVIDCKTGKYDVHAVSG